MGNGVNSAIAGIGLLQESFRDIANRKEKVQLQEMQQRWASEEARKKETHDVKLQEMQESGATARARIGVAPAMGKLGLEREAANREVAGYQAGATELEKQEGFTATPEGAAIVAGAKKGIDLSAATKNYPPIEKQMMFLQEKAFLSKDPALKERVNNMMNSYNSVKYNEAYFENLGKVEAASLSDKPITMEYDPTGMVTRDDEGWGSEDYGGVFKSVVEGVIGNKGWDGDEPLMNYFLDNKVNNAEIMNKTESLVTSLAAKLAETDNRMAKISATGETIPTNTAFSAARRYAQTIMTSGLKGLFVEGEGGRYVMKPIQLKLDNNTFYTSFYKQQEAQAQAQAQAQKTKAAPKTTAEQLVGDIPVGKTSNKTSSMLSGPSTVKTDERWGE